MENTDQDLALKPSDYLDKVQLNKLSYKDKFHLLQFICKLELQDDAIKDLGFEDGAKMVLYYCDYLYNASWKKDE